MYEDSALGGDHPQEDLAQIWLYKTRHEGI